MSIGQATRRALAAAFVLAGGAVLAGCPPDGGSNEYDAGYVVGFAQDDEYWQGYDDSWDTVDGGEIYYSGSEIPDLQDDTYDDGYYDGLWYAYNDGYFVAYDYAFTIGFSEGYDLAFYPDWFDFLQDDEHVEWLDGGFTDGYNDGFSEGRIFGAVDYDLGFDFDWLLALDDYRAGTDEYIEELDLGTGEFGPVFLYEYGTDPNDLVKSTAARYAKPRGHVPSIRSGGAATKQVEDDGMISYRSLTAEARADLGVKPTQAQGGRGEGTLRLNTTWLQRIEQYQGTFE